MVRLVRFLVHRADVSPVSLRSNLVYSDVHGRYQGGPSPSEKPVISGRSLHSVPSLDAIAEQPELADGLSRQEAFRLYLKAQSVATLALAGVLDCTPRLDPDRDELINARETARILGRSVSWVQQRARSAPLKSCLVQSLGRGLLFSRRKIDRLIARDVGQNPEERTLGLRGVNSGRRAQRKGNAGAPSTS